MACCATAHACRPQLRALSPSFLRHRHLVRGNHKSQRRRRLKHHHGGGRDPKPRREAHSESFLDMILLCAPTYVPSRRCTRKCRRFLLCNGSVTCDACAMRVRVCVCTARRLYGEVATVAPASCLTVATPRQAAAMTAAAMVRQALVRPFPRPRLLRDAHLTASTATITIIITTTTTASTMWHILGLSATCPALTRTTAPP